MIFFIKRILNIKHLVRELMSYGEVIPVLDVERSYPFQRNNMINYCMYCSQVLQKVYLPIDKALSQIQPAFYCLNRKCKKLGLITVIREADEKVPEK